jgi:hypothetical protein
MSRKRIVRMGCIFLTNATILFFALRLLLAYGAETESEARFDRVLGAILCLWCFLGITAEAFRHPWAQRINIALPISIAGFMVSTLFWLPAVSDDGDRFEAAAFFAIYAVAPICLAVINYFTYRLTRAPDSEHGPSLSGA